MTRPDAHLLSAYRPPTSYPVALDPAEAAAWLNGYFALWHPAVLARVGRPPRLSGVYDHDQPGDGFVYAVPHACNTQLPGDWDGRVTAAGGVTFQTTADRAETLAALGVALGGLPAVADDVVRAFAGVGFGFLFVDTLYDAGQHDRLLDADGFWADVSAAATAADPWPHLTAAAEKLKDARDRLNSNDLWLLDLWTAEATGPLSGLPATLLATGEQLRALPAERLAALRGGGVEIATAADLDRADDLLPPESQWWNLLAARRTAKELLGVEVETAAWVRTTVHPQTPGFLLHAGFRRAAFLPLDGAKLPARRTAVVTWPGLDGKTVEGFARDPKPADDPNTFFNLALTAHDATSADHRAAVALLHRAAPPAVGYEELVALAKLAPVAGEFTTVGAYLGQPHYGDYLGAAAADEYFTDHLETGGPDPASRVASHHRRRRGYDTALALAALYRSLTPEQPGEAERVGELLAAEADVERGGTFDPAGWAKTLADRLQAAAPAGRQGWLVFNPCGFARRVPLELADVPQPIPVGDAVKAAEWANGVARLVVEVPGLGYAWLPRGGPAGTVPPVARIKTAEGVIVRNEFFEAELDPATGGLRAFRDTRTRVNRLGLQLVHTASVHCRATSVRLTHAGPALGEVTAEGELLADDGRRLATFRHRLRAWVGRPALEVRIEFDAVEPPAGPPWEHYLGARLGWRDERAAVYRGCQGATVPTREDRFHAPDFLEVRLGGERTFVFPGGLPFVRKSGPRTADLMLIPPGETCRRFEFLIAADRDVPMQTAQGWITPAPVVATDKGPPGATSGWLGHVDLPSLLLTSLRPEPTSRRVTARFQETSGFGGTAELRFARPVATATQIDGDGGQVQPLTPANGAVPLEFSANETVRVRAEW